MSDPAKPFIERPGQVKNRVEDLLLQCANTAIKGMTDEDRKRIGMKIIDDTQNELQYSRRQRQQLTWLVVGMPIGASFGILAVWVMVVMPLWLQLLGL